MIAAFIGMKAKKANPSLGKRCKRISPNIIKTGVAVLIMFSYMSIGLLPKSQKYISKPFRVRKSEYLIIVYDIKDYKQNSVIFVFHCSLLSYEYY